MIDCVLGPKNEEVVQAGKYGAVDHSSDDGSCLTLTFGHPVVQLHGVVIYYSVMEGDGT